MILTSAQLHAAVANVSGFDPVSFYLLPGTTYPLIDTIRVRSINLTLYSEGEGATLDARGALRPFMVEVGGRLHLDHVHLSNGRGYEVRALPARRHGRQVRGYGEGVHRGRGESRTGTAR